LNVPIYVKYSLCRRRSMSTSLLPYR